MPAKGELQVVQRTASVSRVGTAGVAMRAVRKSFAHVNALAEVTLDVEPGARVALVGPSGCGKSTLLSLVAGLDEPDGGTVAVAGESEPRERLALCALMPQHDLLLPWRSALDNAILPLENLGVPRGEARARARPLFERLGLASFEDARPAQLSGGMRQRVAFLRTLLAGKDVLLLDEPFGALDAITRAAAQEWLVGVLAEEPRTLLLVTHDVEEALYLADRVVVLSPRPGHVVAEVEVDVARDGSRRAAVTAPSFVEVREHVLEELGA